MQDLLAPPSQHWSRQEPRSARVIVTAAAIAAAVIGLIVGYQPVLLLLPVLLVVPVILWKRPYYGVIFLLLTATQIENFTYTVGSHNGIFTSQIPWWRTFSHGMILFPVEFLLLLMIVVWILKAGLDGTFGIPKSPVKTCLKVFWLLLLIGVGVGMSKGAHLKYDLWEVRSWIYLSVAYLLAAAFIKTKRTFDTILWTLVIGTGLKGIEGTYIFFAWARAMRPRPEEILGHEEAFFFGVFITITAALWLYSMKGRLRTVATCLLPFVVIADLANARRTAWLILAASMLIMFVLALKTLPHRRRFVRRALLVIGIGSAIYLPIYWNHDGTLAQPARAVHSAIHPDARDESSDLYRQEEDLNLLLTIKGSGLLGTGFGIPINYTVSIANISDVDPMIAFIPHNGLLWIWARIGMQGEIVFWCLIAAAIVRSCRLATSSDLQLSMLGTIITCAIVGFLIDGYEDMAFAEFRIAAAMGCLLGVMEAATRFAQARAPRTDDLLLASHV